MVAWGTTRLPKGQPCSERPLQPCGLANVASGSASGLVHATNRLVQLDVYRNGHCVRKASFSTDSIRIGSHVTNDLCIGGVGVFGFHAVIQNGSDGDGYVLSVISADHVRLNGINVSLAKLRQGDHLQIANYEIVVQSEQAFRGTDGSSDLSWGEPLVLLARRKKKAV